MRILNLCANEPSGTNQNIGDSLASLGLKYYLKSKNDQWFIGNYHKKYFDLNKFDLVVLGGGGLYNPGQLEKLFRNTNIATSLTPVAIMGIGLNLDGNERLSEDDNRRIITLNKRAFVSTVRDNWSKNYLGKLGLKSVLVGCPSLFLPDALGINKKKRYDIGLNFATSHTSYYQKQAPKVLEFIDKVAKKLKGSKMIICHSKWEKKVYKKLFHSNEVFYSDNPKDVFGVYKACKIVVGMRGHSQIFALAVGTPSIAIPLNEKVAQPVKMIWEKSDRLIVGLDDSLATVNERILYLKKNHSQIRQNQKILLQKLRNNFLKIVRTVKE